MTSLKTSNIQLAFDPTGGRIISLRAYGEEMLFDSGVRPDQDLRAVGFSSPDDWRAFKRRFGFPLFGGDKTWVAPEKEWWERTPPLDLDAGRYTEAVSGDTVVMTSPVCRETGLRIIRSVRLDHAGDVHLREEFVNVSRAPVTRGIWNVSQVPRPFTVYFPGRPEQFRSYYHEDPTLPPCSVGLLFNDGMVGIPCIAQECYKFGGIPAEGYSVLVKPSQGGDIMWERHFQVYPAQAYAHRSAVEVFNSHLYAYGEVEIHAPLCTLAPGESGSFEQRWHFYQG